MAISSYAQVLTALALAAALSGCTVYQPTLDERMEGDGEFVSVPRKPGTIGAIAGSDHQVRIPSIPVTTPMRYTWRIANLPPTQMHTTLCLDEPTEAKLDAIDHAGVRVSMQLRNERTGEVTRKDGRLLGDWGVTPQSWSGTPVDFDAFWFRPSRHEVYFLTIEITAANPSPDAAITATPLITSDPR